MASVLPALTTTLKLLSDPTRLRLCGLLAQTELAVQELVAATGLQQSRISNHLALLKRAGLVRDRREGTWSFHSLVKPDAAGQGPLSAELHIAVLEPWQASVEGQADLQALQAVLEQRRERSREAHDRLADHWEVGQDLARGSLQAELLAQALPAQMVAADLGCGTGFLTARLVATGASVIAVDHSERMLAAARNKPMAGSVEFRKGELDKLPIDDAQLDVAFANLVWHHLPDLQGAAAELARVLKPGGTAVISDLLPHQADWMRAEMGDLRLGLKPDQVIAVLARNGFTDLRAEQALDCYRVQSPKGDTHDFPVFLVRGQRADARVDHIPNR